MIPINMQLEPLNIRTPAVQAFLCEHLVPADFRHDYTRLDAIKEVERQVYDGNTQLWGNLREGIVFRCDARNPKVIEPHIMGNGTKIRGALRVGVQKAWALGFERVAIWTQHDSIARIVEKCRSLGVLLGTDGEHENVIKMRPAMVFSPANANLLMQVLEAAFAETEPC